jgi:hypothetical protein
VLSLAVVALALAACDNDRPGNTDTPAAGASAPLFVDRAADTGLVFHHVAGAAGAYHLPEITGAGAALVDYDGDGDLDAYLLQGGRLMATSDPAADLIPPPGGAPPGNRLFRNELVPGGELRFTDVTEAAGVGHAGYAMGVAAGDYDNDGDADLYVTNVGPDVLYRNEGDGRFADVTAEAGLGDPRWTTSAAFLDYDGDGWLDLYVAAYVTFDPRGTKVCTDPSNRTDYCAPGRYEPLTDRLYRNDGRGGFTDVTEATGIAAKAGPGLGVLGADFDGDGRLEIFVANDQKANFLWRRGDDGRFLDEGLMSGVAYNAEGAAEASMGVTAGDFDDDGDDDLFMTHLVTETNTLYVNDGAGRFTDATSRSNLGAASLRYTGFGAGWLDADADGDLDLFVANGAVAIVDALAGDSAYPYDEPDQLFENLGNGRFEDAGGRAGLTAIKPLIGRGAAFGDVDNDGDVDVLVANNNGPARLLVNRSDPAAALTVRLVGTDSPRDGQGARVALELADGRRLWRRVHADGSYASAGDPRVLFSLAGKSATALVVKWPRGRFERWPWFGPRGTLLLTEGTGEASPDR